MKQIELLPKRIYLAGADYFQVALERDIQKNKLGNNFLQLAIVVDNSEVERVKSAIFNSPILFWCFNTRFRTNRHFNLPYWQFKERGYRVKIVDINEPMETYLNERRIDVNIYKEPPIIIHQLEEKHQSSFLISIHHSLIDGRGMGLLSRHISSGGVVSDEELLNFFPERKPDKRNIIEQFRTMWEVRNFVKSKTKGKLAKNISQGKPSKIKIKLLDFTIEETKKIEEQAKLNGARFGTNFYQMACCIKAYQKQLVKENGNIWIPIPFDGRKRGGIQPMFNNYINFTFFRIEKEKDLGQMVTSLRNQFNKQLNDEIPSKYNGFLNSMLRIPEIIYYYMLKSATGGNFANLLYSSTGESIHDLNTVFDGGVKNAYIIPPFSYPPGISFVFSRFDNQMRISFVFSDNLASKDKLLDFENTLRNALINGDADL